MMIRRPRKNLETDTQRAGIFPEIVAKPYPPWDLALTEMSLGNKAAALTLAERAMAVNPVEKDALTGPAAGDRFVR